MLLPFFCVSLLAGCVPVTEPVGDITKAEPNKELLGTWETGTEQWIVDRPEVKGNPKGLMRITVVPAGRKKEDAGADNVMWFFTTTVGKHTYANLLLNGGSRVSYPDLGKEEAYEKWLKSDGRGYWVGLLTLKGDDLTLDGGDPTEFNTLMKKEKFAMQGEFYKTPPGWLAKHLEKNGPDGIFTKKELLTYKRVKK
jgi:hypothetical protein